MRLLSRLLIVVGLGLIVLFGIRQFNRYSPYQLRFNISEEEQKVVNVNAAKLPVRLIIKSLKINLPVYPAKVSKKEWGATEKGASYMSSTPPPGENGNSVLYGHNWESLLGKLTQIKKGDHISIILKDGSIKNFVVDGISTVSPEHTQVLGQTSEKRLTIYTCTGFFDTGRFVASARLVE